MSDCFKPTCYNNKTKQTHWINNLHLTHDLICFCPTPTRHLLLALAEQQETIEVSKQEKEKITRCLITTEEDGTTTDVLDGMDEVGLDALFAEDFEEKEG
nr:hypothetical protein [TTV-like mini virus]